MTGPPVSSHGDTPTPAPPDRPIALIGLMGSGKSTIGARLARRLGLPFVDSDAEIEAAARMSIAELFEAFGEEGFRDGERRVIARLMDGPRRVIATGGGAWMDARTRALLAERALVIWLRADIDVLVERVGAAQSPPAPGRARSGRGVARAGRSARPGLCDRAHDDRQRLRSPRRHRPAHRGGAGEGGSGRAMTTINVTHSGGSYPVEVVAGSGLLLAERLGILLGDRRWAVVTDATVRQAQSVLFDTLDRPVLVISPGEGSKGWATLARLVDDLLAIELERGDAVVAIGGGVIGDLAGFAAAILKRGCRLVQVPTTLLAQVDSSVGGKTGINTAAGKNLVGAFKAPDAVLIDPDLLATLPPRQLRAGWAEVVKYGLIDDAPFFDWCEANADAVLARDGLALAHAIAVSVRSKARIVAADERETTGVRALLNLGHTFAHALEAEAGYSDRLLHGEAVAAGMALALRFSAERGLMAAADAQRAAALLHRSGLPTTLKEAGIEATGARAGRAHGARQEARGRHPAPLSWRAGSGAPLSIGRSH